MLAYVPCMHNYHPNICCGYCYRAPPRNQPSWEIMANCVWIKWTRLLLRLIWMGMEDTRDYFVEETTSLADQRRARDTFVGAAETVQQGIEWGYITESEDTHGFLDVPPLTENPGNLAIPKGPVQTSPLKGWNNAYHDLGCYASVIVECGRSCGPSSHRRSTAQSQRATS